MNNLLEKPLISVIIPTYNRARSVGNAIKSVINQSYKNLDIIIVDDASSDNTKDIIDAVDEPRLRYISHAKNAGGAAARNSGLDAALGEYVTFLDSDDTWLPNKLELQLASIQSHPHSEKVVSYAQMMDQETGSFIRPLRAKHDAESLADFLFVFKRGGVYTSTLMMPRTLALSARFRPELRKHQDWDLCLRLEAQGAIFVFIEEILTLREMKPSRDRISMVADYHLSLAWLRECQDFISPRAAKGFLLKEVFPKLLVTDRNKLYNRLYAEKLVLDAGLAGLLSTREFIKLTAMVVIPTNLRKKFKAILNNKVSVRNS